ncbi:hypothetical protein C7N43_04740 [Sphingobacteriales bacterium UPWRP_1]|nr:hypothetical protein BVG80_07335 [Sphingobacteriales bacterium TSM_CSM]PSJ78241.1 hypothetical protein C7N43_04740 [Sphingobacteriales bacterium UPWRP_1]
MVIGAAINRHATPLMQQANQCLYPETILHRRPHSLRVLSFVVFPAAGATAGIILIFCTIKP